MSTRPGNDELPILDEVGHDLASAFRREERAEAARRNRRRLRGIAGVTAALFVVVPGAVATRSIWAPDPGVSTGAALESARAVAVADGRGEAISWRLSAYKDGDSSCWQLAIFTPAESLGRSTNCGDPADRLPLSLSVTPAGGETVVFGWLSPQAVRVRVSVPGAGRQAARIVSTAPELARRAGVPAGMKGYVATFRGELADTRSPRVTAFAADGRELGTLPPRR